MKKSFTFVSLLGLFVLATMQIRTSNRMGTFIAGLMSNSADDRGLVSVSVIDRPKIHTFFHDLGAQQEYEVLQLWKDEWWKAGFDPIVLTLDDAKKNPFFRRGGENHGTPPWWRSLRLALFLSVAGYGTGK